MSATTTTHLRTALILLIAVLAFVTTYQVAEAADRGAQNAGESAVFPGDDGSTPACACYGNSGAGETTEGAATVEGNVQRSSVDATNGYDPDVIRLTAGVPAEITFSQASGCMAQVMSDDLDFYADLTGGPQTVRIEAAALQPGEYSFSCGMQMVFGTIIVQ